MKESCEKVKNPKIYGYSEEGKYELGKHDADVGANSVLDDSILVVCLE